MTVLAFYPNKLDRSKREFCPVEPGQTLHQWLTQNIKAYQVSNTCRLSYAVNDEIYGPEAWDRYVWQPGDLIELTAEPKDPVTQVLSLVAVVAIGTAIYELSQIPDNYQKTTPEGSPIYSTNAQGNRPRLMGIIPELFGRHKTYPDIISEPHWYFSDDDEYLMMMTAISVGDIELTADNIFIGDTPISRYGSDIDFQVFPPGSDVTGHLAHQNIYTSREVGATASTSGIELKSAIGTVSPYRATLADKTVLMTKFVDGTSSAYWPEEWEPGHRIEIQGTGGAVDVHESHQYGGWRGAELEGGLFYWSKDPELANAMWGQYVQYPVAGQDGEVEFWKTGVISTVGTGSTNGEEFNLITVVDVNGEELPPSTVASSIRYQPVKLLSPEDGYYRIKSVSNRVATLDKLYPNKSTTIANWRGFDDQTYSGLKVIALTSLPGQPAGAFFVCPSSEVTDRIYIDIKLPDGLGYMNDDGDIESRNIKVMIEWRGEGESQWNQRQYSRTAGTRDQLGDTVTISLGRKVRPEVRFYRITGDSEDSRVFDRVEVKRLKARLPANTRYDDFTTLAIRIRGSNSLSRNAENKLGVIPIRKLQIPDGNGGWTTDTYPTRDIAPAVRYIILDSGLTDVQIGQNELLRLHDVWRARGDTFDAVFTDESTLFEVLKKVLAVGYAEPTLNYGQIVPVRDEPRSVPDYPFMPDNMLGKGLERSTKLIDDQEPDGIEVEYFSTETWKPETLLCLLPGDLGIKPQKVRAFGITDPKKAWQFGMRVRRKKRYRRTQYTFQTEMDGFNLNYLSFVALADDVPGYAQSGRLEDYQPWGKNYVLRLDMPVEWGSGTHHIVLRKPDGKSSGPYPCTPGADPFEVVISTQLDFKPTLDGSMEPPLWLFGEADRWCYPALIEDVDPRGMEKCAVKAVNYDVRVYEDDDHEPDENGYPKVA